MGKEEIRLSLFADDMIQYRENPKDSIRKLLELTSEFRRLQDTKSIHRNHLHFYIVTMKNKKEIKESIQFTIATKQLNI